MAVRSESWSRPAEPGRRALLLALALSLFFGVWAALHAGFYARSQIVDTPVYQRYGDAIAHGRVPYRDFGVEYPPGALPVFAVPALGHSEKSDFERYRQAFETLMWICGGLALFAMAAVLQALGAGGSRLAAALGFAALAPLALGSVILSRFDLWPAAILVAALAACFAPFLALAPGGVWDSVVRQTTRPLQLESLGSGVLLALHHLVGLAVHWTSSHGSQNLVGTGPDAIGALQTVLQVGALLAVLWLFARGPGGREELVRASAASVVAFVALGKVLSPQYLIWLIPLVPLVRGRRGLQASGLLAVALVLTQVWFPFRYWDLVFSFDPVSSWLVLARDLVLLALLATLVRPERA